MRRILQWLALLGVLIAAPAHAQPEFPELTGRVVDAANIIPDDIEADLTARLEALETQSQRQLVVATVPTLQDYEISDYGYQLGRAWGLGDAQRNDGAILLVAPNERRVRIEVGYGLEAYLTDALSSQIIQNDILPRFRDDDYPGGVVAGTDALIAQLTLSPEDAARVAQEAAERQQTDGGFPVGALIWLGFIFFFFILPVLGARGRRRKYRKRRKGPWDKDDDDDDSDGWGRTARDIILWEVGSAIVRGALSGGDSDGGDWGGGGFGGGFSGGGGSFGGGGASGGW